MDAQQSLVGLRERLLVRINVQEKARILALKPKITGYGVMDQAMEESSGKKKINWLKNRLKIMMFILKMKHVYTEEHLFILKH